MNNKPPLPAPRDDGITMDAVVKILDAARGGHLHVLKAFAENNGGRDMRPVFARALQKAVEAQQFPAVQFLVAQKVALGCLNPQAATSPMHAAAVNDNVMIALHLLHRGAPADERQKDSLTPVMMAVRENKTKVMKMLLKHGASQKTCDDEGNPPLHMAVMLEHAEAALALLECGGDVNQRNRDGLTPLMLAAREKKLKAAAFLLDAGADTGLRDDLNETAAEQARVYHMDDAAYGDAFGDLVKARLKRDAATLEQPFHDGAAKTVKVTRPLQIRRP